MDELQMTGAGLRGTAESSWTADRVTFSFRFGKHGSLFHSDCPIAGELTFANLKTGHVAKFRFSITASSSIEH
jgi:hypothetical protein